LKSAVISTAEKTIGYQQSKAIRKPCVTQKMIDKMEERRNWKNVHTEEGRKRYKAMNNQLRRITDKAREQR